MRPNSFRIISCDVVLTQPRISLAVAVNDFEEIGVSSQTAIINNTTIIKDGQNIRMIKNKK